MRTPLLRIVSLQDLARAVPHRLGVAIVLKGASDVVVLEAGVVRLAGDVLTRDRRPGDAVDQVLDEGSRVGRL